MKNCQYVRKFFNLMRIQTYNYDAKLITTMKVHHHHHFSFHLGHQCNEVIPFIDVSNFTFVILVLLCHFDTSLYGTVGGGLDVWDKSIIKTNSLTWRYGCHRVANINQLSIMMVICMIKLGLNQIYVV